jgi:hypothetical protein
MTDHPAKPSDMLRWATRAKEFQLELEQVRRNWHKCREANMQSLETIEALKELLTAALDRADNAEERLALARGALIETGYFTEDEVGDDIAARITEMWSNE